MARSLCQYIGVSRLFLRSQSLTLTVRGRCSNKSEDKQDKEEEHYDPVSAPHDPEEPTTCCMSGCANCVWIQFAELMVARHKDGGAKALEAIQKINDPMMKAFLMMELKSLDKK